MNNLEQRLQRLEDIEAIRQLKARYFHACDRKDVAALRDCFCAGDVHIDYGALGTFHSRDEFLALFTELACHEQIIDMHHGQNAQIKWHSSTQATATWDLYFHQIDRHNNTLTQLAGYYEDEYQKHANQWQMARTVFRVSSTCLVQMDDTQLRLLFAGQQAPSV